MTAARGAEAERLRRCRRVFERAMRDCVTMEVARQRVAEDDWREAEAKRQAQHRAGLCGTASPALSAARPRPHYWFEDL